MTSNILATEDLEFSPTAAPALWDILPSAEHEVSLLIKEGGFTPLVARILAARGISCPRQAQEFISPSLAQINDPFELRGMQAACERIGQALQTGQSIMVYGDYDVDGVTSTAILMLTLKELGAAQVDYHIPHRLHDGYGLNCEAFDQFASDGVNLVISVDCGITAVEEIEHAAGLGIEVIVTDHHEPGDQLPAAVAVVNPKQEGCAYPFKGLAGAGVAFKLAHALLKTFHPDPAQAKNFLVEMLDLATLGTVADIVPMHGENRALVAHGLERLRKSRRLGVLCLLDRASVQPSKVDTDTISFALAPRLNAAGRTQHAHFGVELLLSSEPAHARKLAGQLEQFNQDRRSIEQDILDEALALVEPYLGDPVLVVEQDGWHYGVLGIVASRLLNRYHRPTIIIGIDGDQAKGSGRSVGGFDLHGALGACSEYLVQYGGHKMAAGLTIEPIKIDAFRQAINAYARGIITADTFRPQITIDTIAHASELTEQAIGDLARLAPYGPTNPKPVIALEGFSLIEPPRLLKDRHLRLRTAAPDGTPLTCLGWSMAHRYEELAAATGPMRLAGTPMLNTWNGRTSVELELKDFQLQA